MRQDIFANQMKHVRPLKPYEIFMANIEAGNEQQLVIKRLVESYSLTLGPNKAYGVICAVATLERIYSKYGYHVLDRTLRLCVGTWEGDIDSLGGNILAGVARLVVAFGDQLRDETFKEKVGFMSVDSCPASQKSVALAPLVLQKPCSSPITENASIP